MNHDLDPGDALGFPVLSLCSASDRDSSSTYRVYGLRLHANRPIPDLTTTPDNGSTDVWIEMIGPRPYWGPVSSQAVVLTASPERNKRGEPFFQACCPDGRDGAHIQLRWADGETYIEFLVAQTGDRIRATWSDDISYHDVLAPLLGVVLGCVLRMRGITCLHASVVAVDGAAVVMVGRKFGGKSTLAAALAQRGHAVLSDDLAVLVPDKDVFLVQPGYLRMRLWPNSIAALPDLASNEMPRIWSMLEKRYLTLTSERDASLWRFQPEPLPLAAVYVLEEPGPPDTAPSITPISPAGGLVSLMQNTYVNYVLDRAGRARDFEVLGRLAATVPLRQVHRPFDLDAIPQTCAAILDDFRSVNRLAGIKKPQ